jgi:hypothetical protein
MRTANGTIPAATTVQREVRVGGISIGDVRAGRLTVTSSYCHILLLARFTFIYRVLPVLIGLRAQGALVKEGLLRGCDERPEGRLAELDSRRENSRGLYRTHGPGPTPSCRRLVSRPTLHPLSGDGAIVLAGCHGYRYRTGPSPGPTNHGIRTLGSVKAVAEDSCTNSIRTAVVPRAITATAKHATMNTRMVLL